MSEFRAYYVWPDFPSISISGRACGLECLHCAGRYLDDMIPASDPDTLVQTCTGLRERGARGVLLSGGCDASGRLLNLDAMLPAVARIHEMGLIIKLHTGLVDRGLAEAIASAGVDIASQEMVGDADTINHIFGLDTTPEEYLATFKNLQDAGIPHICPHVCVGLHDGKLRGEFRAIDMLASSIKISTLAVIVLRPTRGTALAGVRPPGGRDVEAVVAHARKRMPDTKIILGALRPRGGEPGVGKAARLDIEMGALRGGIDGAEVPSQEMLDAAVSAGMRVKRVQAFGVLPVEYEGRVRTDWLP